MSSPDPDAVARLERELDRARGFGARMGRSLYLAMAADLAEARERAATAERQATRANRRAEKAERRAVRAERALRELRESTTWKAGRAVVAVPAAIRRSLGRRSS